MRNQVSFETSSKMAQMMDEPPRPDGFEYFRRIPTNEEIDAVLNRVFTPIVEEILSEKRLLKEYYQSGMSQSQFACMKQKNYLEFRHIFKKYGLPAKMPRSKNSTIDPNAERAEFDGKHYRY